jgi:hypothetical protein
VEVGSDGQQQLAKLSYYFARRLGDICSTGNLVQRTCLLSACISLSFTYLQVRAEDEG